MGQQPTRFINTNQVNMEFNQTYGLVLDQVWNRKHWTPFWDWGKDWVAHMDGSLRGTGYMVNDGLAPLEGSNNT